MSYYSNLTSLDGRRGIFSIILTATILTMFEIAFFYSIVVPGVEKQMDTGLEKVSKMIAESIKEKSASALSNIKYKELKALEPALKRAVFNKKNMNVMQTLSDRETKLVDKVNLYTKVTGFVLVALLCMILFSLYQSIKADSPMDLGLDVPVQTAGFVVSLLISFQVMFYFMGLRYWYPGSLGDEELIYVMSKNIK